MPNSYLLQAYIAKYYLIMSCKREKMLCFSLLCSCHSDFHIILTIPLAILTIPLVILSVSLVILSVSEESLHDSLAKDPSLRSG